jgi:two-component system osmolarity sensor histidine kinase EnvZ
LRLGVEIGTKDDSAREGMVADIEQMDKIIGQFLDFARDEREVPPEPCNLNEIVAPLAERERREGRDVRFAAGALPPIALRATAMSRLVANLLDNALTYGGPPVEIATRFDSGSVVLEISDRGPGIAAEDIERLKRPFTRGEPARTGTRGAGLGLAIVERIARLHGGDFRLAPRDGGGTLARVSLPAVRR